MKIKILQSCTGHKFTFTKGEVREVTDYIGNDLIGAGFAEAVADEKSDAPADKPQAKTKPAKRAAKKGSGNADD